MFGIYKKQVELYTKEKEVAPMYIVHIASELAPIAKVGGLGDVTHGLSKELMKIGHTVEVILPKYDCLDVSKIQGLKIERKDLLSFEGAYKYPNTVWSGKTDNIPILLLEPHHPKDYFNRGMIYGCPDDIDRFAYFCRAVLEYLFKAKKKPNIVHLHDWPTALIPVLYKEMYTLLGLKLGGTVFTIHNLQHQGKCAPEHLTKLGLRGDQFLTPETLQDPYNPKLLNLLKGGIQYADLLTTVSPNYEKEIVKPLGGFGLDPLLLKYQGKLKGILNGIDESVWNPEKDPYLTTKYKTKQVENVKALRKAKQENKNQLRARFHLNPSDSPLVAIVSRLAEQKAPALIKHALYRTLEKGGQFVLLGSGSPEEIKEFALLKEELKENKNVAICLDKNEALAHLIYAGADLFVVPSLFEPCGLTQMIALRYGTVPVVRKTGGLADTIFDVDTSDKPPTERNGFTFDFPDNEGVNWALDRALDCYNKEDKKWNQLILNGIKQDYSWTKPALTYTHLYKTLFH